MVGERYGKLVVIEEYITTLDNGARRRVSKCKCDCGNFITVRTDNLKSGNTKSCGCSRQKAIKNMIGNMGFYGMKYEVHWVSGNQDNFHGAFDTLDEAQASVRDWWNKNNYTPPYIRTIIKEDCVVWDYGLHHAFYIFKKVAY